MLIRKWYQRNEKKDEKEKCNQEFVKEIPKKKDRKSEIHQ